MHLQADLHTEHEHLLEHVDGIRALARDVPHLDAVRRDERLADVLHFLHGTLMPHAQSEENGLYRGVAAVLGDPRAVAPMLHDHRQIIEYVDALAAADVTDGDRLQELLYGVHALIVAHFRKEEELYLPLVTH